MIFEKIVQQLTQLQDLVNTISDENYCLSIPLIGNATIGKHLRHIIEHYQMLLLAQKTNIINYENRPRNIIIESQKSVAIDAIKAILLQIKHPNFPLKIVQQYEVSDTPEILESSYYREIIFLIEHTVHHQAFIKFGILAMGLEVPLKHNFGYADATLKYQSSNVQS